MMDTKQNTLPDWLVLVLLVVILLAGGYLRLVGLDWDAEQHLHPDERFLTMVESSIEPVTGFREYFDTEASSLNPNNNGYGFYVYGTLPIFLVRYVAEWTGQTGYSSVYLVGRLLSGMVDLLTVLMVFFLGSRLYNRRVGLAAASFSAFAVLQIQQAHFFTVDTFTTFFMVLALYFAAEVATSRLERLPSSSFLLFGVALGMAGASKINAVPIAVTLPLAAAVYYFGLPEDQRGNQLGRIMLLLVAGAFTSLVTFRIFQPFAFSGPGFWGLLPNEQWVAGLQSLRAQTSGDVDFPPALQWARRPFWFSWKNMVLWGLGLPYGILAWSGFFVMGWKMIKEAAWKVHLLLWSWTGFYFIWQSAQWNSTMRYQLPVYPLLAVFAGWLMISLWDSARDGWRVRGLQIRVSKTAARGIILGLFIVVLSSTAAWAYAFSSIYPREHPRVEATGWIFENIPGAVTLLIEDGQEVERQLLPFPEDGEITPGEPWQTSFTARSSGELVGVILPSLKAEGEGLINLIFRVTDPAAGEIAEAAEQLPLSGGDTSARLRFASGLSLDKDASYQVEVVLAADDPPVTLSGAAIANESSWDDGLPLRMEGYDPFGGIYQGGLNFEMYWDDNQEKLERFKATLNEADYILITSSRQWASTTRVPERYPLTTEYYRQLLGCPLEKTVEWCYNVAREDTFQGSLGFELIKIFESNPQLGPWEINDQFAEEAFTVYDHPKVFVFQKSEDYDPDQAASILEAVDLTSVIHLTPKEADNHRGNLMLPPDRLEVQRAGGTWDELFNVASPVNKNQVLGTAVWYLSVFFLGMMIYPLSRQIFSGLADRGYPLARLSGMLLLSYLVWLAGSVQIPFHRLTIGGVLLILAVLSGWAAFRARDGLREDWRTYQRTFWIVEALALAVFLLGLLIRFQNPDLWHPWKGGEKPMDFSYFNAVLKSTTFPPYDPWFAGGYINYYYYGFVLVGVLVKFLGIVPSFAYNLILPTLFMFIALGAFSAAWNLLRAGDRDSEHNRRISLLAGLGGVLGTAVLGNLGTVRMILQGLQRLASPGADLAQTPLFRKVIWTIQGVGQLGSKVNFPYRLDDWYWIPSRAIGAEHGGPITEFPFFTFLYGDLHAHFLALPLTLLVIGWSLSLFFSHWGDQLPEVNWGRLLLTTGAGGLFIGALRPTNTWDFYPYLALGAVGLVATWWVGKSGFSPRKVALTILHLALLGFFAFVLFQPYSAWYGQGYSSVGSWTGSRTPLADYLTHWGLFLFLIVSWMGYETLHWMAVTPVSALNKLIKAKELILAGLLILMVVMLSLGIELEEGVKAGEFTILGAGIHIIWLVLPLMVWTAVLLFRPGFSDAKRSVLFLTGTALALSLTVEIIRLEGDIGRMNTVFKFYLSAWTLLAVSSGASFAWLIAGWSKWPLRFKGVWQLMVTLLIAGAALYPLMGGMAKARDRMAFEAPHTLDGMEFMKYAEYQDLGTTLDLHQDYQAIRWMQENVPGSPVIVEANHVEYHWGSRFTVYTGLPGVVGWNWHQRQQRNLTPHAWVFDRVEAVNTFYNSTDLGAARDFLEKFAVEYIIVGEMERAKYSAEGIEKFSAAEGVLWELVYEQEQTAIYRTLINRY